MLTWAGKKEKGIPGRGTPRAKAQKHKRQRYMEQRVPVMEKKKKMRDVDG